jgi:hypothetical protein
MVTIDLEFYKSLVIALNTVIIRLFYFDNSINFTQLCTTLQIKSNIAAWDFLIGSHRR